jgi:hypothetical protein
MDSAPGNNVIDSIGTTNPTALNAGLDLTVVPGIINNAIHYSGASNPNARLESAGPNNFDLIVSPGNGQSMSCWFNIDVGNPVATPCFLGCWLVASAPNQFWFFGFTTATLKLFWAYDNLAGATVTLTSAAAVSTGAWHHAVFGYDPTNNWLFLYVDGGAIQTAAIPNVRGPSNGFSFTMCGLNDGSGEEIKGALDEVAIWHNRVLNATDVANLYNGGAALPLGSYT